MNAISPEPASCHGDKAELRAAASAAGMNETIERYAVDYPMGPHDQPQSMCPAFGSLRVVRVRERLFPDIERFAEIGQFMQQPVKTYSSGMFVRLAFAVAVTKPLALDDRVPFASAR